MTSGREGDSSDDALSWDGDDDPTLDARNAERLVARKAESVSEPAERAGAASNLPKALPKGFAAVGKGSDEVGRIAPDGTVTMPSDRPPMGNATLIGLGVLGGVYLLYAIGWLIGAGSLSLIASLFLEPIAFQVTLWLAVLAPPIWFVTVMVLTRGSRRWIRFTMLTVGAIVLIPWPFVLAGAAL